MLDCLLIGHYDVDLAMHANLLRAMGEDNGAYRDLRLAFVRHGGRPQTCMDMLNEFHPHGRAAGGRGLFNTDFLWPAIAYLGSYLYRRGFTFDYVNAPHLELDELAAKLREDVRTVAITTTLYVSPQPILELVAFVRRHNPAAKIVVGGPYVANQAQLGDDDSFQDITAFLGADYYVVNQEGEFALGELLGALRAGREPSDVKNLAYWNGAHFVRTESVTERNELADEPVLYDLFGEHGPGRFMSVRTAKSCPYACAFCGFPQRAGKYTYLGVDLVERELDALHASGVDTVTFLDDTFNVPKERFKEILRLMIRKNYGFRWNSFYRSDQGDAEAIRLMGESGCEGVFLGVESGSDEMLRRMNKTARRSHFVAAIPQLRDAGIWVHANLIVGFPAETDATVADTVSLLEETEPDSYRAQLWYADPVTPIWKQREVYGLTGSGFTWSHDTMDSQTACDLVEMLFAREMSSVWLPQQGFEQWSAFYLKRHGMTTERIKTFIRLFNTAVKRQLQQTDSDSVDPALLAGMRAVANDAPLPVAVAEAPAR